MGKKRQRKIRPLCRTPTISIHSSQQQSSARSRRISKQIHTKSTTTKALYPKGVPRCNKHPKPKKAPGHDNITATILQQLPRKGQIKLLYIFDALLRLDYWPCPLKTAQIIMILKPRKNPADITSYRPISLLLTIAKDL
jgi:hypothetical protein